MIRIKPDWNVKYNILLIFSLYPPIRIKPDWNVKLKALFIPFSAIPN